MSNQLRSRKLGFIGGGNMASALIGGLLASNVIEQERVRVSEPDPARREVIENKFGISASANNAEICQFAEVLVLCVKPQVIDAAVESCRAALSSSTLVVSILAGVPCARLERVLGGPCRVVRAMPNTPALVGAGATALCAGRRASGDDLELASEMFRAVGSVVELPESLFDVVTALSGSGPGYFMLVVEALVDGAVQMGMPRSIAQQLTVQTMLGSAKLQIDTAQEPASLRAQVTSPGGTTSAGLFALEKAGVRRGLMQAITDASKRSRVLGGD
jgi:pyrroline-5-carboxylate reductase